MDPNFYSAYNHLYQRYQSIYPTPIDVVERIKAAIEEEESILGTRLRPDAKYFLLVNFHQLVFEPVIVNTLNPPNISPDSLFYNLREDIRLILNNSREDFYLSGEEITGHAILSAISRLWSSIRLFRLNIWG